MNFIDPSGHAHVRGDGASGGKCSQGFSDDYPTFGNAIADGFMGWVKSVDDAIYFGIAGKLSNEIKNLFGIEKNDWDRLQENPDFNLAYKAGSYTNAIFGVVNLSRGLKQIVTSGGTVIVNGNGEVISVISGTKEGTLQAIASVIQSVTGTVNAASNNNSGSGGEGDTSKSLKSIGNNKRANEIAEQLGFEAEGGMRPAEVLKSNYVDDISHFDIMKNTQTNEIVLQSKNGVIVETGLKLPK